MAETGWEAIDEFAVEREYSGAVAAARGGRVLFERAYGLADRSNRIANALDTRFGIASGTKGFTAVAAGRLIDAGALSLATPLADCLGCEAPGLDRRVTIDHLLTHTSGVYDYFDESGDGPEEFAKVPWYELRRLRDYVPLLFDGPPLFEPGARFQYSNGGYVLLGLAVEHASGRAFQSFVEDEVLAPCGMADSGFFWADRLPERTALGYVEEEDGWRTNVFRLPIRGGADGGAYATAADLGRFWRALHGGELISADLLESFLTPVGRAEGGARYGRGFWLRPEGAAGRTVFLEGRDAGVSFKSWCRPGDATVATLISNTAGGVWPLARAVERLLWP